MAITSSEETPVHRRIGDNAKRRRVNSSDDGAPPLDAMPSAQARAATPGNNPLQTLRDEAGRTKNAARKFLRHRMGDNDMALRLQALGKLSWGETLCLHQDNRNRTRVHWYWDVLDVRIARNGGTAGPVGRRRPRALDRRWVLVCEETDELVRFDELADTDEICVFEA